MSERSGCARERDKKAMSINREEVILVDVKDNEIGSVDKTTAHVGDGCLHRAFSVFIMNDHGQILLQRRAFSKYHCPGLWANSCCSHPQPGEDIEDSAQTRLQEELGINAAISSIGKVVYKIRLPNGLVEHELDHIFVGFYSGIVNPNPAEVFDCKWLDVSTLRNDISMDTDSYVPWLQDVLPVLLQYLSSFSCQKINT